MNIIEVMKERHSVRQYCKQPIEAEKRAEIDRCIAEINSKSGLHMQVFYDEPECFDSFMAHYGKFVNVENYIASWGRNKIRKKPDIMEKNWYF